MTVRERFYNTLHFKPCTDRAPMMEWAAWWDQTVLRWHGEGLDPSLDYEGIQDSFGLDKLILLNASACAPGCPKPETHGGPLISGAQSYQSFQKYLFRQESIDNLIKRAVKYQEAHQRGDIAVRVWLDGFFWFPRELFGIEPHLFAFYDQPELMKQINQDLADFNCRAMEALFQVMIPDMVGFAEDMSYNHGPMLSYGLFQEFLLPYYRQVIPVIKRHGIPVMIDSDGDITTMIPWMEEAGIDGVYPLEHQAGVDIVQIRKEYPRFLMLGGYDKMVMPLGEDAMRAEFERILPVIRSGGYIPSVDHQTPPGVSLENYQIYLRLFEEYCKKAVQKT